MSLDTANNTKTLLVTGVSNGECVQAMRDMQKRRKHHRRHKQRDVDEDDSIIMAWYRKFLHLKSHYIHMQWWTNSMLTKFSSGSQKLKKLPSTLQFLKSTMNDTSNVLPQLDTDLQLIQKFSEMVNVEKSSSARLSRSPSRSLSAVSKESAARRSRSPSRSLSAVPKNAQTWTATETSVKRNVPMIKTATTSMINALHDQPSLDLTDLIDMQPQTPRMQITRANTMLSPSTSVASKYSITEATKETYNLCRTTVKTPFTQCENTALSPHEFDAATEGYGLSQQQINNIIQELSNILPDESQNNDTTDTESIFTHIATTTIDSPTIYTSVSINAYAGSASTTHEKTTNDDYRANNQACNSSSDYTGTSIWYPAIHSPIPCDEIEDTTNQQLDSITESKTTIAKPYPKNVTLTRYTRRVFSNLVLKPVLLCYVKQKLSSSSSMRTKARNSHDASLHYCQLPKNITSAVLMYRQSPCRAMWSIRETNGHIGCKTFSVKLADVLNRLSMPDFDALTLRSVHQELNFRSTVVLVETTLHEQQRVAALKNVLASMYTLVEWSQLQDITSVTRNITATHHVYICKWEKATARERAAQSFLKTRPVVWSVGERATALVAIEDIVETRGSYRLSVGMTINRKIVSVGTIDHPISIFDEKLRILANCKLRGESIEHQLCADITFADMQLHSNASYCSHEKYMLVQPMLNATKKYRSLASISKLNSFI